MKLSRLAYFRNDFIVFSYSYYMRKKYQRALSETPGGGGGGFERKVGFPLTLRDMTRPTLSAQAWKDNG